MTSAGDARPVVVGPPLAPPRLHKSSSFSLAVIVSVSIVVDGGLFEVFSSNIVGEKDSVGVAAVAVASVESQKLAMIPFKSWSI